MAVKAKLSDALAKKPGAAAPEPAPEAPAKAARAKDDRKGMTLRLSPEAWKQLKHLAVETGKPAHDLIVDGVNAVFERHGKPMIAEYGKKE